MSDRSFAPTSSIGCFEASRRSSRKWGWPQRCSVFHSSANLPYWMSSRIFSIAWRVSWPMTRLPRVMSPYSAVLLME